MFNWLNIIKTVVTGITTIISDVFQLITGTTPTVHEAPPVAADQAVFMTGNVADQVAFDTVEVVGVQDMGM